MKVHKSLRIDEDVVNWLQTQAKEQGRSFNNYVGNVLRKEKDKDKEQVTVRIDEKGIGEFITRTRPVNRKWK